jgi:cobalt-zinc-cadmium efflux system protein
VDGAGLTSTFLVAEVIAGILSQSLALLADAAYMFTDVLSMRLVQSNKDSSLNVKGAWADRLGSIGVIVAALVIRLTGWALVNTVVAVGIWLWVLPGTWVRRKERLNTLLEGAPKESMLTRSAARSCQCPA